MSKLTNDQLAEIMKELYVVTGELTAESDLSVYVKDSIDLGELIAVVKERFGAEPRDMLLFKTRTNLGDVAQIFDSEY